MTDIFLETIKVIDGEIFHIDYHQKRYESVLNTLGVREFKNLQDYIKPPKYGFYRCRLVYTKSSIELEYIKYTKRDIKKLKLVYDNDINYSKKSTCRDDLDRLFEQKEEADDILIVKDSLITDTSIANIALFDGEFWYTPKNPLLNGTTRQRFLDEKKLIEKDINEKDIYLYKKVALLNAMIDFDIIASKDIKDVIC